MLALVSCTKEKAGKQVPDGALVHFTIASNEVETRTVYGEKYEDPYDGNRKKQQILWKVGDEVIIIMYDPDNFADHQKATYVVVDTPEDMTWKPEVAHHRALVKIKDMDGNEPLRWNKEWTKRKFAAYFVPSMQEAYQTDWLDNTPQGVIDPDLGSDKGVGYIPICRCLYLSIR